MKLRTFFVAYYIKVAQAYATLSTPNSDSSVHTFFTQTNQTNAPTVENSNTDDTGYRNLTQQLHVLQTATTLQTVLDDAQSIANYLNIVAFAGFVWSRSPRVAHRKIWGTNIGVEPFWRYTLISTTILLCVTYMARGMVDWSSQDVMRKIRPLDQPFGLSVLTKEACVDLHALATVAENSAEEQHGIKKWQTYWNQFESIFVQAGKAAHLKVITHATNLTIRVWPYLPYIPDLVENPTLAQEIQFKREFIQWSRNHSMTIPRIKMDLEAKYMDMQNDETMRALWQGKDQSTFGNDSIVLFEQLGRVFSYQSSLPNYCIHHVKEPLAVKTKMVKIRKNNEIRNERINLVLQSHFEARNVLSRENISDSKL